MVHLLYTLSKCFRRCFKAMLLETHDVCMSLDGYLSKSSSSDNSAASQHDTWAGPPPGARGVQGARGAGPQPQRRGLPHVELPGPQHLHLQGLLLGGPPVVSRYMYVYIYIYIYICMYVYIYIYIYIYIQLRPFSLGQKSDARSQDPDHCMNNSAGPEQRRDRVRPAHDVRDNDGIKKLGGKPGRN